MDHPLNRILDSLNPNIPRAVALMTGGLIFFVLPCGLKPGKVPASLMLMTSSAMLTGAIVPLRRWQEAEQQADTLKRAEGQILHARLTAQTLGAVEQAKQEFLPQTYAPQAIAAQIQTQMQQAIGSSLLLPSREENEAGAIGQFEELDLAAEAAASDKSLLVSGISGVGKTRFVQHFIHAAYAEYGGEAVFDLISFKSTTEHFCGLEKTRYYIESGASGSNYESAADKVQSVVGLLDRRVANLPYYFIADEVNNGLKQAEGYCETDEKGKVIKNGQTHLKELQRNLSFIVTQGRERKIRGVFTAHGNLMSLLGIDGDTAQSLVCAVLGRKVEQGDGFSLIDKALSKGNVFFSTEERQRLIPQFRAIKAIATQSGQAIALTNIKGSWELVLLPHRYAIDPGAIQWEVQNASTSKLYDRAEAGLNPDIDQVVEKAVTESSAEYLQRMWQLEFQVQAPPNAAQTPSLSKPAQAILDKYQTKEMYGTWIDAKWVKNYVFYTLELKPFSVQQIRGFLQELAESGRGFVDGEDTALRWYFDPEIDIPRPSSTD
ncbi:MAG TPA: hypothetical protein V6C84_08090 [Coleofasciculaceae cyanobacterium]|jgi:hypothetical protein